MTGTRWSLIDLIDLEFFLHQDDGEDLDRLAARDREIYSDMPAALREESTSNAELLHHWLLRRRANHSKDDGSLLPGAVWHELMLIFLVGAVLFGLFTGSGLAFSFLVYSGTRPINVAAYFGIFVGLQAALFLLLLVSFFFRYLRGGDILEASLLYNLAGRLFSGSLLKCMVAAHARAGVETRLKWAAYSTGLKQLGQRYGPLFFRPFFLLVQLFGVSFNCGVLAATLLKVIGSDLAFGWQSTLRINAEAVHTLVERLSLPWSWAFGSVVPSLEAVEGSRLILKNGIYYLSSQNLTAWWPFLCLSVFCYGLLPRLALLTGGMFFQRREQNRLSFDQGCFRRLIHQMRTPLVSTAAHVEPRCETQTAITSVMCISVPDAKRRERTENTETEQTKSTGEGKYTYRKKEQQNPEKRESPAEIRVPKVPKIAALIPDEIFADCPLEALEEQVHSRFGYQLCQALSFWTMDRSEEEELAALQTAMKQNSCGDVLLLQEAWQPPIQELLTWLDLLRKTVGPKPVILIALIGKPTADTVLTPVRTRNLQIWQRKLAAVNDPGLQLIELIKSS